MQQPVSIGTLAESYTPEAYASWIEKFPSERRSELRAPGDDPDNDGATNFLEFITGTNPLDRASAWREPIAISTYAGSQKGDADGSRLTAEFNVPILVDIDSKGQVWVVENTINAKDGPRIGAHRIRKIDSNGRVSTVAGGRAPGYRDGPGRSARFRIPNGLAVAPDGTVYVADRGNHRIREISPQGRVSTLAGGEAGFRDGRGSLAAFNQPIDVCLAPSGDLYVADFINRRVRRVSQEGDVETLPIDFSNAVAPGNSNIPGREDEIDDLPAAVSMDPLGHLMVTYWSGSGQIYWLDAESRADTFLAGLPFPSAPRFAKDGNILFTLVGERMIFKVSRQRQVQWKLQLPLGTTMPAIDGSTRAATFGGGMFSVAELPNGNLLTCDAQNHRIRQFELGPPEMAALWPPATSFEGSVAIRGESKIPHAVIRYTLDGAEPTIASAELEDGIEINRSLTIRYRLFLEDTPISLVQEEQYLRRYSEWDGIEAAWKEQFWGAEYDLNPDSIGGADPDQDGVSNFLEYQYGTSPLQVEDLPLVPRKELALYGKSKKRRSRNKTLTSPYRLGRSPDGAIYFTERSLSTEGQVAHGSHRIRRLNPDGSLSIVAGGAEPGFRDGLGETAQFRGPSDVLVDDQGQIFVSDTFNNRIRRIDPRGDVKTLAGSIPGDRIGRGNTTRFRRPTRLRWAPDGRLLILDSGNRAIKSLDKDGWVQLVQTVPQSLQQVSDFIPIGEQGWLFADRTTGRVIKVDSKGETSTLFESEPFLWAIHPVANQQFVTLNSFLGTGTQTVSRWSDSGALIWSADVGKLLNKSSTSENEFQGELTDILLKGPEQILVVDGLGNSIRGLNLTRPELLSVERLPGNADDAVAIGLKCAYPDVEIRHSWSRDLEMELWEVYQSPVSVSQGKTLYATGTIGATPVSAVVELTAGLP